MITFNTINQSSFGHFLINYKSIIVAVHIAAASAGLGFALLTDYLFFKYLRDRVIDQAESRTMNSISKFIWLVILVILLTGVCLYLPMAEVLNDTPRFLLKMFVTLVIIFNGLELNIGIGPQLPTIFGVAAKGRTWRRLAFLHGAISMTSWCTAFFLAVYKKLNWDIGTYFLAYIVLLFLAMVSSQIFEAIYYGEKVK